MGQRLNIEFNGEGGEMLANAYYHWDAYTSTSINHVRKILKFLDEHKDEKDLQLLAIQALQATGALLQGSELEAVRPEIKALVDLDPASDRNEGLLCITQAGMDENHDAAEESLFIDLVNKTIDFGVIWKQDKQEYKEYEDEGDTKYKDLPRKYMELEEVPFDQWAGVAAELEVDHRFVNTWDNNVYTWIE